MRRPLGVMLVAGVWMASVAISARAQKPDPGPAPCSVAPQPDPCGTTPAPAGKSAADKFPFPGVGAAGAPDAGVPSISGVPQTPDAPGATSPAAKSFPFPGDADKPDAGGAKGASSSSSSSSSADDDATPADPNAGAAGAPGLKDAGSSGSSPTPGRHILHRVNPIGTKLQTNDEREQEDLDVAHFYLDSGDLQGAYLRGKDAVKTAPDDPDAHLALAGIALKLNKKDEAIAEYSAVLKLDPTEKQAKDARKALTKLKP